MNLSNRNLYFFITDHFNDAKVRSTLSNEISKIDEFVPSSKKVK